MVRGFAILLLFQFLGEMVSRLTHVPVPGNVIGMGLLLLALGRGWVNFAAVREASELLLSHLALFFIPAGVGVMLYFDLIAREWLPITVAFFVSSFAVMAATGWTAQLLGKKKGGVDVE